MRVALEAIRPATIRWFDDLDIPPCSHWPALSSHQVWARSVAVQVSYGMNRFASDDKPIRPIPACWDIDGDIVNSRSFGSSLNALRNQISARSVNLVSSQGVRSNLRRIVPFRPYPAIPCENKKSPTQFSLFSHIVAAKRVSARSDHLAGSKTFPSVGTNRVLSGDSVVGGRI